MKLSGVSDLRWLLQDEATRAWNLHIALYYKADGTPWRMPRRDSDLSTCYVGVSFYRTTDVPVIAVGPLIAGVRGTRRITC